MPGKQRQYIKSVTIGNFRCYDSEGITVDTDRTLTSLVGMNGSGKTSVLEAIYYLLGSEYLQSKITEKDFYCDAAGMKDKITIVAHMSMPFACEVSLMDKNRPEPVQVVLPCEGLEMNIKRRQRADRTLDDPFVISKRVLPWLGATPEFPDGLVGGGPSSSGDIPRVTSIKKYPSKIGISNYTVTLQDADGCSKSQGSIREFDLAYNASRVSGLPRVYYLSKDRCDEVSGSYSLVSKILTDLHWRYLNKKNRNEATPNSDVGAQYNELATHLRGIVDEKGKMIQSINGTVRSIASNAKDFRLDFFDIGQPFRSAFLTQNERDKLLLPTNLGSGFNILLSYALFRYVAQRERHSSVILLIDEPELHLHRDWEKKMYASFAGQGDMQIVYSTQSENFISLKHWRRLRLISGRRVHPQPDVLRTQIVDEATGKSASLEEYLDDYAEKNLEISSILSENLELFFTQKCILVEGPDEKYALPKLLHLSNCDLDDYSVSIIPAWGKCKIKQYQAICRAFEIPFFTVFDTDQEDDEPTSENSLLKSGSPAGQYFAFETSFECTLGISANARGKFQKVAHAVDAWTTVPATLAELAKALKKFIDS